MGLDYIEFGLWEVGQGSRTNSNTKEGINGGVLNGGLLRWRSESSVVYLRCWGFDVVDFDRVDCGSVRRENVSENDIRRS